MDQIKTIGNINILDLRKATKATLEGIERVENVNIVLTSPETRDLLGHVKLKGINATATIATDVETQLSMGPVTLSRRHFEGQTKPSVHLVMGPLFVEPDTPAEEIESKIAGLVVMGPLVCPDSLAGLLQSKGTQLMGPLRPYPADATLVRGGVELNAQFLNSLEDDTSLFIFGPVQATQEIPADLLRRKIRSLGIQGSLCVSEENLELLRGLLTGPSSRRIVVPSGFRHHKGSLILDQATIESLTNERIHCTGSITIDAAVDPEAFDRGIAGLASMGAILCPSSLRDHLAARCDLLENQVIFYEGELWVFDDKHVLRPSRFEYLEGKATVVVTGELKVEPEIAAQTLADRLHAVHNFGEITCTPDQLGAIEARLGIHDGELVDSTKVGNEPSAYDMGNCNVLTL